MALYIQEHLDHRGFSSFPQSEDICGWNSVGGVPKNSDILGSTGFTARVKKKGQKKALPWVFFNSMICHKGQNSFLCLWIVTRMKNNRIGKDYNLHNF